MRAVQISFSSKHQLRNSVDLYWARTRVLERLNLVTKQLPEGVIPTLGPDATGVGQIFWYTLESDQMNLRDLRTLQDWFVRYQLNSVPGVAEVASVGGYVQQYQVDVDPNKLRAYALPLSTVVEAVQRSNNNVGGNVVEQAGQWAVVRGVGLIESVADVENIVIGASNALDPTVRMLRGQLGKPPPGGLINAMTLWARSHCRYGVILSGP